MPSSDALRWAPTTEDELRAAADGGLLEETHYLDLKRDLKPGNSGNKELAKDIAAFCVDGGVIVIGVAENDGAPPSLHPIDTTGVAERIEQVARMRVDAPVQITSTAIASTVTPGAGYLVVRIPQSPRPPHMAENRYYARGDKTNITLSDPEVVRLHERASAARSDLLADADDVRRGLDVVDTSPLLIVLAEPVGGPPDLLTELAADEYYNRHLSSLMTAAHDEHVRGAPPSFAGSQSRSYVRRPNGVAATVGMYDGDRFTGTGRAAEVVFEESGRLTLVSERPVSWSNVDLDGEQRYLFEDMIVDHARLMSNLAACVGDHYGFTGTWRFAVVINGLQNARSAKAYRAHSMWGAEGYDMYTRDDYRRATQASTTELHTAPGLVVERLVGSLLRSVGSYREYAEHFRADAVTR